MFPLIAISAFFILGIAFFVIGKDDFGIQKIKNDSTDTSSKDNMITNLETKLNNESTEEKVAVGEEPLKDNPGTENTSA